MDTTQYPGKMYTKRRRRGGRLRPEPSDPGSWRRPKSKAKNVWIIAISEDGCEHCLTGLKNWQEQPKLRYDVGGKPMRLIKKFEADTYEEAREIYEAQL